MKVYFPNRLLSILKFPLFSVNQIEYVPLYKYMQYFLYKNDF